MKSIIKKIAVAATMTVAFPAFAQNIVRTPVPTIPGGWQPTSALTSDWEQLPDSISACLEWFPPTDEVPENKAFTQTRECEAQEKRTVQGREFHRSLGEYRLVGDPAEEFRASTVTESRDAVGTQVRDPGLIVLNAIPGVSGIYTVMDKKTEETFDAYVNMTDDGGNWVLALYWVSPATMSINMGQVAVKLNEITSYTANAATYPVIPTGVINGSTQGMVKSEYPGWVSAYGAWQVFDLFEQGFKNTTGFPVKTPTGTVTLWTQSNAWGNPGTENSRFALWTSGTNAGACGGSGRSGTTKICPSGNMSTWSSHVEGTANKFFFLKAK